MHVPPEHGQTRRRWLLEVFLGPVQDMIATARTSQDLWFGSYLLGELSKETARALIAHARKLEPDGESAVVVVFPGAFAADSGNEGTNPKGVANRVVLALTATEAEVHSVVMSGRDAYKALLRAIYTAAFDRVRGHRFRRVTAEKQVEALVEFLWVAVPLDSSSDDGYSKAAVRVAQQMGARKNVRPWKQLEQDDAGVPKSSLDPRWASVIHESAYEAVRRQLITASELWRMYRVGPAERVDGITLMKRLGLEWGDRRAAGNAETDLQAGPPLDNEKESAAAGTEGQRQSQSPAPADAVAASRAFWERRPAFHSTSHVASAPFRQRLAGHVHGARMLEALEEALVATGDRAQRDYRAALRVRPGLDASFEAVPFAETYLEPAKVPRVVPSKYVQSPEGIDGRVFYEEQLGNLCDETGGYVQAATRALRDLINASECQPTAYYALMLGDGDRMGAALSAMSDAADHAHFSTTLEAEFASQCAAIVAHHGGSLVYSGGDDVLAYVPLHTMLDCALELQKRFTNAMQSACSRNGRSVLRGNATPPTLSLGVAIAHHLTPLSEVRAMAVAAEKLAKKTRDSIAVTAAKRSGSSRSIVGPWHTVQSDVPHAAWGEGTVGLPKRLMDWQLALYRNKLPDGVEALLREVATPFLPGWEPDRSVGGTSEGQTEADLLRPVIRQLALRVIERRKVDGATGNLLRKLVDSHLAAIRDPLQAIETMADEIGISRILLEAYTCAWGPCPPERTTEAADTNVAAAMEVQP